LRRGAYLGAHVFVVDARTFPVHRDRRFCGVLNPPSADARMGLVADLKTLRKGDLVFFYKRRIEELPEERGFYGIYRIVSEPFFDDRTIEGIGEFDKFAVLGNKKDKKGRFREHPILPNRVLIEPVTYFDKPIPDNIAYVDRADPDHLWTMLFRKIPGPGRARSITHLLPEEEKKLIRLLYKINLTPATPPPSKEYPYNKSNAKPIEIDYKAIDKDGCFLLESSLKAWLAENIDRNIPTLREVIGPAEDIEFFSPEVLYGIGGEKVDFLVLHRKKLDNSTYFRYKVTVIETKKGVIDEGSIFQVQRYSRWMAQLVPESDVSIVQPIVVGHYASSDVIATAKASSYGRQPIIIEYAVEGNEVKLIRRL
jgi:hypothetical protein